MNLPIPTDTPCLIAYGVCLAVGLVLRHKGYATPILDHFLGSAAPPADPTSPPKPPILLPVPPVGHGGLAVTGVNEVIQFLRSHMELADLLKQISSPSANPPSGK